MVSEGMAAFGTLLKIGDGGNPETFVTVAAVRDITGPGFTTDLADITAHDSPGAFENHVPTILRTGQITFDINFIPGHATHGAVTGLLGDWRNRTRRNFQLVLPDAASTTWTFTAYVVGFQPSMPVAGGLSASISLKIVGQPTLA